MSAAAAADGSQLAGRSAQEDALLRVTRRRIYLQRLVGDGVLAPKKAVGPRVPVSIVLRFIVYLVLATVVIMNRSDVQTIFKINRSLETALLTLPYYDEFGNERYFGDIRTTDDVKDWMNETVVRAIQGTQDMSRFSRKLCLLGFNRVVPFEGTCLETASVAMTMRRVGTTANYSASTTARFTELYPRTWLKGKMTADSTPDETEETRDILGNRISGVGRAVWKYSPPKQGYMHRGGYVAVMSIHDIYSNRPPYVHLLDYDAADVTDEASGLCTGLPTSSSLTVENFFAQPFLDASMGSLVLEFTVYNANMQTMSKVTVKFEATFAGLIATRSMKSDTFRLDTYHPTMRFFDLAYLVFTCAYLLAFMFAFVKRFSVMIWELFTWVNLLSIVMSLTSLIVWYMYAPFLEEFKVSSAFLSPAVVGEFYHWTEMYKQTSAIAAMTIWLRLLEFVAAWKPRVQALSTTLRMGAANILVYLAYIFVVFAGFCAFAQNYFSTYSEEFTTPFATFLSCFKMFFGQVDPMNSVDGDSAVLLVPFYILFMVFFYFVSVQMFSAIVNYSYNRVSEQMEAEFENERRMSAKKGNITGFFSRLFGKGKANDPGGSKDRDSTNSSGKVATSRFATGNKESTVGDKKAKDKNQGSLKAVMHSAQFENLGDGEKARVEAFLNKDAASKDPDSCCRIVMVIIFCACYLAFLSLNLSVFDNFQLSAVVGNTIKRETGAAVWDDMVVLPQAAVWMEDILPQVIFNSTPVHQQARAVASGLVNQSTTCIKSWNCLVTMEEPGFAGVKAVRITQRRGRTLVNRGVQGLDTPDQQRFTGGIDNDTGLDVSEILIPFRAPGIVIAADSPPDDKYENTTASDLSVEASLQDFCQAVPVGGSQSYKEYGGLVCLLNADYSSFMDQVRRLKDAHFFSPETSTWLVEFTMQNSNRQLLSHTKIVFTVKPSGQLEKYIEVGSVRLFSFAHWFDNFSLIAWRLAPGIIYMGMTVRFLVLLWEALHKEWYRRKHKDGDIFLQVLFDFFRLDVFNLFEAASIVVSFISAAFFILWTAADLQVGEKKEEGFTSFLAFSLELSEQANSYNRLSAVNVLLIGMRPFKFVRENPRVSKMYQSFWGASNDIFWFVIMLFFTLFGFLFFVHLSFGPHVEGCSSLFSALVTCFRYLLGDFDLEPLVEVEPGMSVFMFPYLLLMYCVFTNIFFAIIDRHFVAMQAPPFQWKRKLKPILARVCRCIEWDEDFVMEQDPNAEKKQGPPSRRDRVKTTQMKIQALLQTAGVDDPIHGTMARAKALDDVCDNDDRIDDVLTWSRDEARKFVTQFQKLATKKRNDQLDETFVKEEVMKKHVEEDIKSSEVEMEHSGRFMKYATQVHEALTKDDQATLARYIAVLERKIQRQEFEKDGLNKEVDRLESDVEKMRGPEEHFNELRHSHAHRSPQTSGGQGAGPIAGQPSGATVAPTMGDTVAPEAESESASSSGDDQVQEQAGQFGDADSDEHESPRSGTEAADAADDPVGLVSGGESNMRKAADLVGALDLHRSKRQIGRPRAT